MIFKYSSYLDYFKELIEERELSLRSFAANLGIDHTVLSRVLKGERKLPLSIADKVSKNLKLSPVEKEYFILLVELDHVQTERTKNFLIAEIKNIQKQRNLPLENIETFEIEVDFLTFAIFEMLALKNPPKDTSSIAKALKADENKVQAALTQLISSGIIKRYEDGSLQKTREIFNFKLNTANSTLENYFRETLDRAKDELDHGEAQERIYRTRIASIPSSLRQEICLLIDGLLGRILLAMEENHDDKNELICLNINFFSLYNQRQD